jgi:hypothetical protein
MAEPNKPLVQRLLIFHLSEGMVDDPERILNSVAAQAGCTRDEVWTIYEEMIQAMLYK